MAVAGEAEFERQLGQVVLARGHAIKGGAQAKPLAVLVNG